MSLDLNRKAIALLSGGLDSRLAVKLIQKQDIEVEAINFVTPFCNCTAKNSCKMEAKKASDEFGIRLRIVPLFDEFMEVVKKPKYGYGRGMNPCLDCRILMFKKAGAYMRETNASFLVTGEVLGERPMSQRVDAIKKIERDSGLSGLIVRPLSARLFEPSIPERNGLLDRTKFLSISGRSRKPQMRLASEIGIGDYPCPAGGCLLTDKVFAARLRSLISRNANPSKNDVLLLKVGRHFLSPLGNQIVVGRNEAENLRIAQLSKKGDWLLEASDWIGPTTIVRGEHVGEADLVKAAQLTAGYGKGRLEASVNIACGNVEADPKKIIKNVRPYNKHKEGERPELDSVKTKGASGG